MRGVVVLDGWVVVLDEGCCSIGWVGCSIG